MSMPGLGVNDLRREIDAAISAGNGAKAFGLLRTLWREFPGHSIAGFVLSGCERLKAFLHPLPYRVGVLRSFTLEPATPLLRAAAALQRIDLTVELGGFNTYMQDVLDPGSSIYAFQPDAVILAVHTLDIAPGLWDGFSDLRPEEAQQLAAEATSRIQNFIEAFRKQSQAHLIVHSLQLPAVRSTGILDENSALGQYQTLLGLNAEIARLTRNYPGVFVLDLDGLACRIGRARWYDDLKWRAARLPVGADFLPVLANEWLKFIVPLSGRICKSVVLDLDNTLWGGVLGEDGIDGIQIGEDYPGSIYRGLQRAVLDLYRRGIILGIISKNDTGDAIRVFDSHPGMMLRTHHFAAMRINWNDKATSLREIAEELNIGIDSIAFVDDNPMEREWVRTQLPEVEVIDLPDDPRGFEEALRAAPVFERVSLSTEDRERGKYYSQQRLRDGLHSASASVEEFYASLDMSMDVRELDASTLARAVQLAQKTNQFNLTTRRYSLQELTEKMNDPNWQLYVARVVDRFGDNGWAAFAAVHRTRKVSEIDNLLLSCRVIGRAVETALLAVIVERAYADGIRQLRGTYIPSAKNGPAKSFYPQHGFKLIAESDAEAKWSFDLTGRTIGIPKWIRMMEAPRATGVPAQ